MKVDPRDNNRVYAVGGFESRGFYIISRPNGPWQVSKINLPNFSGSPTGQGSFNKPLEIAVWEHNNSTHIALARQIDGDGGDVLYSSNNGNSFEIIGDVSDLMSSLNSLPDWYDANTTGFGDPSPRAIAGDGNNVYVAVAQDKHRRNLGVFKGTINSAGNSANWSDFTGSGNNRAYFSRSWRADIFTHQDGSKNLYLATFGSGTVRTPLTGGGNNGGGGGGNLLTNAGFETGNKAPWDGTVNIISNQANVQSGTWSLRLQKDGANGNLTSKQTVNASPNQSYSVSGFVKTNLNAGTARIRVICYDSNGNNLGGFNTNTLSGVSGSFSVLNKTFTSKPGTATIDVMLQLRNGYGQIFFDGIKLEAQ